jgi:hypothetical protein
MQSLDEIKVELSQGMQTHLDTFQRNFLDQVQENIQAQVRNQFKDTQDSKSTATTSDSTISSITATIDKKMRREANGNKNFRESAHNRLSALEESIKKSAEQQQQLQAAIQTQQAESTTQQELVANQMNMLSTTMQSIHEAHTQGQQQTQENMLAMQQLTQTTFTQAQATQANVKTLTGTINELAQLIQAQAQDTPRTTANIIRSERRHQLPPTSSTPRRPIPHARAIGSDSPDKKKTCQQSTPQRPPGVHREHPGTEPGWSTVPTTDTGASTFSTPNRIVPPPPPSTHRRQYIPTQAHLSTTNQYASLAEDAEISEDEGETKHENDPISFTPAELDVIHLLANETKTSEDSNQEETPSSKEHNRELGQEVQEEVQDEAPELRGEPDASEETL